MPKNLIYYILLVLFAAFWVIVLFRRNEWYKKLSNVNGRVSTAHIYNSYKIKSTRYYNYIYNVGNNYYTESTTGLNVTHFNDSVPLQCFLVAYYKLDPTIHTIIWSYKFDTVLPLGINLDTLRYDKSLIRKYTTGWNGLGPRAKMNDKDETFEYKKRSNKS